MALVNIDTFGGIAPRYTPRKLAAPYAAVADNCKMDRAQLRAFAGSVDVGTVTANTKTLFQYKPFDVEFLLEFPYKAKVVQNALPDDPYRRVYWTGHPDGPRFSDYNSVLAGDRPYPVVHFSLGIPSPTQTPILAEGQNIDPNFPADPDGEGMTPYYRYFTYTFVDKYGHESAPFTPDDGSPLPQIKVYEGQTVSVTNLQAAPQGNHNIENGLIRLYQTDLLGNWRLIAYGVIGTTEFLDIDHMDIDDKAAMLPEVQVTALPPADLDNLVMHPTGYLMGSTGATLCATPPGFYSSWPVTYRRACQAKIMGIVPHDQGAFLITEKGLYSAIGSDPANLTILEVDATLGCVSRDSIVDMGGYAMYASYNGLAVASTQRSETVTTDVILHNDWPTYSPETMRAFRHQDRYFIWNAQHGFVLKATQEKDKLCSFDLGQNMECWYTSEKDGYLRYKSGVTLKKFDADTTAMHPYKWRTTQNLAPAPVVFNCYRVDAEDYTDLKMDILVDGASIFGTPIDVSQGYLDGGMYYGKLPVFRPGMTIEVELTGTEAVNSVVLATSFAEMKDI